MTGYDTTANINDWMLTKLYTRAWDAMGEDNRQKCAYEASRILNALPYCGCKTDPAQEHEFPRDGETTIPQPILNAFYEIVKALASGIIPEEEYEKLSQVSVTFKAVRSTYDRSVVPEHTVAGIPSIVAWQLIKPYLRADRDVILCRV